MQRKLRRAIITRVWVGSLVAAGPVIGYVHGASERLALRSLAADQEAGVPVFGPMRADAPGGLAGQAK